MTLGPLQAVELFRLFWSCSWAGWSGTEGGMQLSDGRPRCRKEMAVMKAPLAGWDFIMRDR